jgi:hypothetical protein
MSTDPRLNFEMESIRRRREAAQSIANRLGVTVGKVLLEWRKSEERQKQWMQTLKALGYRQGEDPKDFLHRINNPGNSTLDKKSSP